MNILPKLILFPVYIVAFLMDVAIFFLVVRLLAGVFPVGPLLFLDRIGSTGVDEVTDAMMARTGHWFKRPLSRRQEYAFALLLISLSRWLIGAVLAAVS